MKKFLYVLFVLMMVVALTLSGCSGSADAPADDPVDDPTDDPVDEPARQLRVAMILPGPINDGGWNTSGYNGLLAIEDEAGAEIAFNESTPVSDYEEVLRNYAVAGFDIVIGHSSNFSDSVKAVAPEFPDTHFVVTSTNITQAPNVSSLANDNGQQGFMLGVIAATITETNKVAGIASVEIVSLIDSMIGFEAGAKYINPDIEVFTTFTGSHDDAAGAKELALSFIDQGVDVLFPNANAASLGVIEAAEERGAMILGSTGDMAEVSPETVVTSGRFNMGLAFTTFVDEFQKDGFQYGSYTFGLAEGVVFLAPFYEWEDKLEPEQLEFIQDFLDSILAGEFNYRDYADVSI